MIQIFTIAGTAITIVSFVYAVYINRKHQKLINYNREQAWEVYRQTTKVLGFIQELEQIPTDNKDMIIKTAKGEAATQELVLNAMRMIKRFEPKYDLDTIQKWEKEGKMANDSHTKAFKGYIE